MGDNFLDAVIEVRSVKHNHSPAAETLNLDISAYPDNLEFLAPFIARMRLFHLHDIVKLVIGYGYHGSSSILTAKGFLGRPGIVITSPVKGTMKPAPAERLISRM